MSFLVNPYLVDPAIPATRTWQGYSTSLTSRAIGTATADRRVVVALTGLHASFLTLSSVTIGGITATKHRETSSTFGSSRINLAIVSALVPTGTTATIVATYNQTSPTIHAGIWSTTGLAALLVERGNSRILTSATNWSTNLEVSANGLAFAVFHPDCSTNTTTTVCDNMTRDYINAGGTIRPHYFSSAEPDTLAFKPYAFSTSSGIINTAPFIQLSLR